MEYNWFAQLYWDCLYAQWGHDIFQEITEACIHKQSAFEYRETKLLASSSAKSSEGTLSLFWLLFIYVQIRSLNAFVQPDLGITLRRLCTIWCTACL